MLREKARPAMTAVAPRSEHDLLGHRDVPAEAYWGVHTLLAREPKTCNDRGFCRPGRARV